jgi:hypothetical protein
MSSTAFIGSAPEPRAWFDIKTRKMRSCCGEIVEWIRRRCGDEVRTDRALEVAPERGRGRKRPICAAQREQAVAIDLLDTHGEPCAGRRDHPRQEEGRRRRAACGTLDTGDSARWGRDRRPATIRLAEKR